MLGDDILFSPAGLTKVESARCPAANARRGSAPEAACGSARVEQRLWRRKVALMAAHSHAKMLHAYPGHVMVFLSAICLSTVKHPVSQT